MGRWQGNNGTDNNFKGYIDNLSIDEKPPAALNFGESNGVSLNLINPYTTSTGKTYYYVDAGGDGSSDTRDSILQNGVGNETYLDPVTHQQIDAIFNGGLDTDDSLDSRSIIIDGYTVTLPSLSELQALRAEVTAHQDGLVITEGQFPGSHFIPEGWGGLDAFTYWTSTGAGADSHELYGMGSDLVYSRPIHSYSFLQWKSIFLLTITS